jgi:hypothetical protein
MRQAAVRAAHALRRLLVPGPCLSRSKVRSLFPPAHTSLQNALKPHLIGTPSLRGPHRRASLSRRPLLPPRRRVHRVGLGPMAAGSAFGTAFAFERVSPSARGPWTAASTSDATPAPRRGVPHASLAAAVGWHGWPPQRGDPAAWPCRAAWRSVQPDRPLVHGPAGRRTIDRLADASCSVELFYNTSGASTDVVRQRREALWLLGSIGRSSEPPFVRLGIPYESGRSGHDARGDSTGIIEALPGKRTVSGRRRTPHEACICSARISRQHRIWMRAECRRVA